jgi:hypothetical protein
MMLVAALAVAAGGGVAQAPAASTKKSCRWVKATKKTKRHKVCTVKRTKGAAAPATRPTPAPALGTPSPAPAAPRPAPAAAATPATPGADTSPFADPAPGPDPAAAPTPVPPPARLQVSAREWSLTLSRTEVSAGALIAELVNRGEDAHDLHLRPASGGPDILALAETPSGDVLASAATPVAAGSYTLYCSLPGHEQAGMSVTLTVR